MALTANERTAIVDQLVTNCSCDVANVWDEKDRPALNVLPDHKLLRLKAQHDATKNAFPSPEKEEEEEDEEYTEEEVVNRERMAGKKTATCNKDKGKKKKVVTNAASVLTPDTLRVVMNQLGKIHMLTNHITDAKVRENLVANLSTKSDEELDMMLQIRGPVQPTHNQHVQMLPNFFGAGGMGQGGGNVTNNSDEQTTDVLPEQTIDFAEVVRNREAAQKAS